MAKTALKFVARGLAAALVAPLTLSQALVGRYWGDSFFAACSQFLSLFPGKTGSYLRVGFYRFALDYCSEDSYIGFGTVFSQRATCIGKRVYIGPQCNIGACRIGKDTLVASGVHIMSGTRQHGIESLEEPIREQAGSYKQISIGNDCWIGNSALVMADVGDQAVVGAGSVVSQALEDSVIAVGNPARIIRNREVYQTPDVPAASLPKSS